MKSVLNVIGMPIKHGQNKNGTQYSPVILKTFMKQRSSLYKDSVINSAGKYESYIDILKMKYNINWMGNFHSNLIKQTEGNISVPSASEIVSEQCERVYDKISSMHGINTLGTKSLFIGGDHSMAIGSISSMLDIYKDDLKVIWIDAHADLNKPETSLSGSIHGQPLSYLMGHNTDYLDGPFKWLYKVHKLKPQNLHYIGLRDLDKYEIDTINELNINFYESPLEIDTNKILDEILNVSPEQKIHISLDVDALCPKIAPSTGTSVKDGITESEIFNILDRIKQTGNLVSLDVTEINPLLGTTDEVIKTLDISSKCILKSFI